MRKSVVFLLLFALVLVLVESAPAAASTPAVASGTFRYIPYPDGDPRLIGGETFLNVTEEATWTGTFEGVSTDNCVVAMFRSGMEAYKADVQFNGSAGGRHDQLTLHLTGVKTNASADWNGHWVVVDGTGGLSGLQGHGTFTGKGSPGFGQEGEISYVGEVLFGEAE